jgi:predicted N-acetyltransferase YhbS
MSSSGWQIAGVFPAGANPPVVEGNVLHLLPAGEFCAQVIRVAVVPAFEIKAAAELTAAEVEEFERFASSIFGDSPAAQYERPGWYVMARANDKLICHVGVLDRTISVGGKPVRIGGIGFVSTAPEWRGLGLAGEAMRRSMALMRDLQMEFGLLFTGDTLPEFYGALGWKSIAAPTSYTWPEGRISQDGDTMIWPTAGQLWPDGEVDVNGLPW